MPAQIGAFRVLREVGRGAYARVFLAAAGCAPEFLGVIAPSATLTVDIGPGTYTAIAESYSSGSWGGGRLSGIGRSDEFTVG